MTALWSQRHPEGDGAEDRIKRAMVEQGCHAQKIEMKAGGDLQVHVGAPWFWVEVKNEDRYATSGNLCLETRQGQPARRSGIMLSESHVGIHTLGERAAVYRLHPLRLWLADHWLKQYPAKPFPGSDNHNAGAVVPIARLLNFPWFELCPINRLAHSRVWRFVP